MFFLNLLAFGLKSRDFANIDANSSFVEIYFHEGDAKPVRFGADAPWVHACGQVAFGKPKVLTLSQKISQTAERRAENTETGAQMDKDADGLGADFELWQQLTDDYEKALAALARGEPGARDLAMKLSLALRRLHPEPPRLGSPD